MLFRSVLTYNGQVILAAFHSASGGHTENVEDIWSQPLPYLRAVEDFDAGSPVYQWTETVSQANFRAQVPGIGNLVGATPLQTTARGRVVEMRLEGENGTTVLSGNDLRRLFRLRSTLRSEEHTSELQSLMYLVCCLLLDKKNFLKIKNLLSFNHILFTHFGSL